jgi:hypothetical protein
VSNRLVSRRWKPAKLNGKELNQDECKEKIGNAHAKYRQEHRTLVEYRITPGSGNYTKRNGDGVGQQRASRPKDERSPAGFGNGVRIGLPVTSDVPGSPCRILFIKSTYCAGRVHQVEAFAKDRPQCFAVQSVVGLSTTLPGVTRKP